VALVEMIGELGGTFGHGVTYDANLHTTLRRRYPFVDTNEIGRFARREKTHSFLGGWRERPQMMGLQLPRQLFGI
jgi:hypothetical protein